MTHDLDAARALMDKLTRDCIHEHVMKPVKIRMIDCDRCCELVLAAALRAERGKVWEEAAKLICPYCNDPGWPQAEEGNHVSPITFNWMPCKAWRICQQAREEE